METRRRNSDPAGLKHAIDVELAAQNMNQTRGRNSDSASPAHAIEIVELAGQINMNQSDNSAGAEPSSRSQQNVTQTDISTGPDSSSSMNNNERHPSLHLLTENYKLCLDLQKAAVEGDVDRANSLLGENSVEMVGAAITDGHETVLHVAAGANQIHFVEKMINLMKQNNLISYLKFQNEKGNTAFCFAAMAGSIPIAEAMLDEDPSLLNIRGSGNMTPLYLAALSGEREMASFLYHNRDTRLTTLDKTAIFFVSIDNKLYDLALKLLLADDEENEIAMEDYTRDIRPTIRLTPLHPLAQTRLHLLGKTDESDQTSLLPQALQLVERLWERILRNEGARAGKEYISRHKDLLFDAAHLGNFKFLEKLIQLYPDLVHQLDDKGQSIFHIAISHRHRSLFHLIYKTGFNKQLIATYVDKDGNNLLHLAAIYPNQRPVGMKGGAALEIRLELKIFKEVESLVKPSFRESKNANNKTPQELFTSTHADLFKKGEHWVKKTAGQSMVVATLIASMVFAAYFTAPAGNDDEEMFDIFAITNATALFSSSCSIVTFLTILTSSYEENYFYKSLPLKLLWGLSTLSISLVSIMVVFISRFFLTYNHQRLNVVSILFTLSVILPPSVYIVAQYSLLRETLLLYKSSPSSSPSQIKY